MHGIGRGDVVLDQDGNAVQRAAELSLPALLVQLLGNGDGIGIGFNDGFQVGIQRSRVGQAERYIIGGREVPGGEVGLEF